MKKLLVIVASILLLVTGCEETKESKTISKKVEHKTENIQKIQSETAYKPLSSDEDKYMSVLKKSLDTFSKKAYDVSVLIEQAEQDPSVVNQEWLNKLNGDFITFRLLAKMMSDMSSNGIVPNRFTDLHNKATESYTLMGEAGNHLIEGIKMNNTLQFNAGLDYVAKSNQKMTEVNQELNEIKNEVKPN